MFVEADVEAEQRACSPAVEFGLQQVAHEGRTDMPIAYLDVPPGIELNKKRELVKGIYDALHDAYPFPDDHRIFVREWLPDSVSQNGLLGSEPARPVFVIHAPQGVNIDAKRRMLKKINAAVAEAYHLPDFMIFIHEYPLELVAHDGSLHSDNQERVEAQRKAYS
jgi:phenylpyruvate tautomerase PptA (4-oxalocrotonate tautomerase family)